MTLREEFLRAHPGFPLLDPKAPQAVGEFLAQRGWLEPGEEVQWCDKAGEGNMNLTLRVATDRRQIVVKQARPWVEKYDHIPAPWDRIAYEQRFYQRTAKIPGVASHMPRLLAADGATHTLVLEDLADAHDLTSLYSGDNLEPSEAKALGRYLHGLHSATRGEPDPSFSNREMRALNHQHIYEIPLARDNGLELESFETGLEAAANRLKDDASYRDAVGDLGRRYLAAGPCLVHGDYFPGSWLRTRDGIRVIDPEFCFYGDPELDLGVAAAHLALAGQDPAPWPALLNAARNTDTDGDLVARYAGVEVMRRLIGVAQLPMTPSTGRRARLLERSRQAVVDGNLGALW